MKTIKPMTGFIGFYKEDDEWGFPSRTDQVIITSYDGVRRCDVIYKDGRKEEVKRGMIFKNVELTENLSCMDLWKLQGKHPMNYKPRIHKTVWWAYTDYILRHAGGYKQFSNKTNAVRFALIKSKETNAPVELSCSMTIETSRGYSSLSGCVDISCYPSGEVTQFGFNKLTKSKRKRGDHIKYRIGCGKKARYNKTRCVYQVNFRK